MECSKYQDGCQESCHNFKFSHTDKILFTRFMILNQYFVAVARLLVSVIEMILLKSFSALLLKVGSHIVTNVLNSWIVIPFNGLVGYCH